MACAFHRHVLSCIVGRLSIFDLTSGLCVCDSPSHYKKITCITWSHDDIHIITGSDDTLVNVVLAIDVMGGQEKEIQR